MKKNLRKLSELFAAGKKRLFPNSLGREEGIDGIDEQRNRLKKPPRLNGVKKFFATQRKKTGEKIRDEFNGIGDLGLDGGRIEHSQKGFTQVLEAKSIYHPKGPVWIQGRAKIIFGQDQTEKMVFVAGHGVEQVRTTDSGRRVVRVKPISAEDREEIRALVAKRTKLDSSQVKIL
ncbi:hypothetical protein HY993_05020 [Candidatus Micrarchaeota archaeon]|nr:hypothetical protein [Candidatus Micrarchaeota archaeon]